MELKFPLARLYVYNNLNCQSAGCASALVKAAYETGLVKEGSLDLFLADIDKTANRRGGCSAMMAAHALAARSLIEKNRVSDDGLVDAVDGICAQVGQEVENYRKARSNEIQLLDCPEPSSGSCRDLAPVIFDYLLQLLRSRRSTGG